MNSWTESILHKGKNLVRWSKGLNSFQETGICFYSLTYCEKEANKILLGFRDFKLTVKCLFFLDFFRTKFEMKENQMMMQIATLDKEKTALKSQLSDLISDITQVNTHYSTANLYYSSAN